MKKGIFSGSTNYIFDNDFDSFIFAKHNIKLISK